MNPIRCMTVAAMLAMLGGCAAEGPAADGASVRALMASQRLAPQHPAAQPHGADGAAAVAAYANYKQSYVAPQPQGDTPMVGTRK